jgi:hypothetical protein
MLSVSEVAKIFEVDPLLIKKWAYHFKEYLSNYANPEKGLARRFDRRDVQVLAVVSYYWEDEPDNEHISYLLNSGLYREDTYREFALLNTPVPQEDLEDCYEGDEAWTHGFLVGDILSKFHQIEIARSYKIAANNLAEIMKSSAEPIDCVYPVLFLYRHCLELYLKVILDDENKKGHQLRFLISKIEEKYQKKMPSWMVSRLLDFHNIDPESMSFRYSDKHSKNPKASSSIDTFWIDFEHLTLVIDSLCSTFEDLIRSSSLASK